MSSPLHSSPPDSLYSERTESEEICYKKSVLEPVTGVQKVDRGGQIERAKKHKAEKRDFLLSFLLRASPHLNAWNFVIHFITDTSYIFSNYSGTSK